MNLSRFFFGSVVTAVGVVLLLDVADVWDAGEVISAWWPVILVAGGVLSLVANPRSWIVSTVLVVGGVALLLRTTDVVDTFAIVGPALLIVVGLAVIFGRGLARGDVAGDRINSFNLFSGAELASHSDRFEGGSVGVVFGGAEIDLRDAHLAPGASIDVFAAFGGVELKVPQGWNVTTRGFPIFGGFDNATTKEQIPSDAPALEISATVLFGGLEIKH